MIVPATSADRPGPVSSKTAHDMRPTGTSSVASARQSTRPTSQEP
ncbi:hypothetical protein IEO21_06605 [Rhodonia placenta]|uniref:Uncharacterized protein n=1 Tax=Rhodonia placenta TaxID=104341 RepID=A0A8H7NZM0_9APHY|nr:hypothetical protein IEO21_06605 [Postia placenta]